MAIHRGRIYHDFCRNIARPSCDRILVKFNDELFCDPRKFIYLKNIYKLKLRVIIL